MNDIRILIVEDEDNIRRFVRLTLAAEGYEVFEAASRQRGLIEAGTRRPDLLVLDLGLPDGDGVGLIRDLRTWSFLPIIVLSARSSEADKIAALDAGADDYLVKPFDLAELSARIGSVARRYSGNPNPFVTHGPLEVDLAARVLMREGQPLTLTAREWALFEAFLARPGQLLSKSQLEDKLYAFGAEVEPNTIEVHISRLRKKLGPGLIETERGLGYRLARA